MLYLIPAAALAAALVLLRPLFGSPKAPHARRRLLANGGVFAASALLLVALSVGAAAAEPPLRLRLRPPAPAWARGWGTWPPPWPPA